MLRNGGTPSPGTLTRLSPLPQAGRGAGFAFACKAQDELAFAGRFPYARRFVSFPFLHPWRPGAGASYVILKGEQ